MKIKIAPENATRIFNALHAVNGRALSQTISSFNKVAGYAEAVEQMLAQAQLPAKERAGAHAVITPAGPGAAAYKYPAKSTTITIWRGAAHWYLIGITEATVYPRQNERIGVHISPAQRDTIAKKALAPFTVYHTEVSEAVFAV